MRKIINQPVDTDSKLNKSGQMIVEIAHRQLQVLMQKMATEELSSDDIRKFETLTRVINSQQKHRLEIEKLQTQGDETQALSITRDELEGLLMKIVEKSNAIDVTPVDKLKEIAKGLV